jgi:hypothetical protein
MKKTYLNISAQSTDFHSIAHEIQKPLSKIDELLSSGKFWAISHNQREKMLAKLRNLFEKLSSLNPKYALKIAGAAMCFTLLAGSANAQSFQEWAAGTRPISFNTVNQSKITLPVIMKYLMGYLLIQIMMATMMPLCLPNQVLCSSKMSMEHIPKTFLITHLHFHAELQIIFYTWGHGTGIDIADFDGDGDLDALFIDGWNSGELTHYE